MPLISGLGKKTDAKKPCFVPGNEKTAAIYAKTNTASGLGSCTWPNGDTYEGEWQDNRMHGQGAFVWKQKSCRYEGQYRDGLSHGKGKLMLAGEGQYEGEFVQGKKDGRGIWMGPDDMVYDGQYREDKRHGHGTLTIQDGSFYQGEWKEGKFDGQGVWTWRDGRRFEGLFSQDQPVEGILTFEGVSRAVTWDAKTGAFVSPEQARAGAADRGSPVGMASSNDMMPSVGLWGLCTTARKEGMPLNSARTSKTGNTQDDEMPPLPVKEGWCPPGTSSYGRYEDSKRRFCAWTGLA